MLVDARTMSAHVVETTRQLSAYIRDGIMAGNSDRDAGFCSGGDEDDNMSGLDSPSASEDSVEVHVNPISLRNKRKLVEPRKIQEPNMAPLKKRRFEQIERGMGTMAVTTTKTTITTTTTATATTTMTTATTTVAKSKTTTSTINNFGESHSVDVLVRDEESRTNSETAGSLPSSPFRPWSSHTGLFKKNHDNTSCNKSNNDDNDRDDDDEGGNDDEENNDNDDFDDERKRPLNINILAYPDNSHESSANSADMENPEISRRFDESRWAEARKLRCEEETRTGEKTEVEEQVSSNIYELDFRRRCHEQEHRRQRDDTRAPSLMIDHLSSMHRTRSVNRAIQQRREHRRQKQRSEFEENGPGAHPRLQEEPLSLVLRGESPRVPAHPGVNGIHSINHTQGSLVQHEISADYLIDVDSRRSRNSNQVMEQQQKQQQQQQNQRNYKNMTRERRIEANARERTRVHTISAAFDTLRRAIPAYSNNQKLSKLSVLRIACSYIMTLSNIANTTANEPTTSASLGACVDLVSRTIQTEGKLRRKKDE